jgi:Tol biopolymer transport system component
MHNTPYQTGRRRGGRMLSLAATGVLGLGLLSVTQPADAAQSAHPGHVKRHYSPHHGLKKADNGRIAFVRGGRIFTATPAGNDVRRLTPRVGNQRPHFSPDGSRIAYIHHTKHVGWNVWVMNADGSGKQQVTHLHLVTEAQWSPDGEWLVFGPTLMKVKSTAPFGDPIPILGDDDDDGTVDPITIDQTVDWSPDGTTLAFYSHSFPESPDNFLLVLDLSSHVISLWNLVGGECCGEGFFGDPAFSRDGKYLAYTHMVYSPQDGEHATRPDIEMDNFTGPGFGPFPMVRGDKDPEFSPNGASLLFSHVNAGKLTIQRAALDGSGRTTLLTGTQPDWQPISTGT